MTNLFLEVRTNSINTVTEDANFFRDHESYWLDRCDIELLTATDAEPDGLENFSPAGSCTVTIIHNFSIEQHGASLHDTLDNIYSAELAFIIESMEQSDPFYLPNSVALLENLEVDEAVGGHRVTELFHQWLERTLDDAAPLLFTTPKALCSVSQSSEAVNRLKRLGYEMIEEEQSMGVPYFYRDFRLLPQERIRLVSHTN